eukprot:COSAG01_NODE_1237_length_11098_cov_7.982726_7_plen_150_part_00
MLGWPPLRAAVAVFRAATEQLRPPPPPGRRPPSSDDDDAAGAGSYPPNEICEAPPGGASDRVDERWAGPGVLWPGVYPDADALACRSSRAKNDIVLGAQMRHLSTSGRRCRSRGAGAARLEPYRNPLPLSHNNSSFDSWTPGIAAESFG